MNADFYRTESTPCMSGQMAVLLAATNRTYEFALGSASLDFVEEGRQDVSLIELTTPYTLKLAARSPETAQTSAVTTTGTADYLT
ncbi:hypothetical protein [Kineococcus sp. SYSU DK002]|uniref:hypothetical protein n=1 Tax=Kineococcus sp. SYSU DK002 TaxID=3383123 RepID=UPI003D7E6D4C